jgi:carboxymethylenebutenolidase
MTAMRQDWPALDTQTISLRSSAGDEIPGYLSRPASAHRGAGVVVVHDLFGCDRLAIWSVVRLAFLGYDAVCPNLFWRDAAGAGPAAASDLTRLNGGAPDERVIGDLTGARSYLRSLPTSNGKVGIVGFGAGAREAVLASCHVDFDAAVDCYGEYIVGRAPDGAFPFATDSIVADLPRLRAPLLGLFGKDDNYPSRAHVAELDEILDEEGKPHEFHGYDHTAHAFMSPDHASYRVDAANDAWDRIAAFFGRHLGS